MGKYKDSGLKYLVSIVLYNYRVILEKNWITKKIQLQQKCHWDTKSTKVNSNWCYKLKAELRAENIDNLF